MAMVLAGREPSFADRRKRVLILFDHHHLHVKAIAHHLESFYRYSGCAVSYVSSFARCEFDLDYFDAVVMHYSVRVCRPGHLSASFARALRRYRGVKALFIQDEYEATDAACRFIAEAGIGVVFTCVPEAVLPQVYPPAQLGHVRFVHVLTGYVPPDLDALGPLPPPRERPILIGYRGRDNAYWMGDLYREKTVIGQRMKAVCDARGLVTDIAWGEDDRIYGDDWFRFLGRCKATLGTESGSNVLDRDGSIALAVQAALRRDPGLSYEEVHARYLAGADGRIVMNQVSPKIFEAVACRTALVLFEGHYSGVVEPGRHYLPLRKDFANVDEVLGRLHDDDAVEAMVGRAYDDVILSGRYSYRGFVRGFDGVLKEECGEDRPGRDGPWLPLPPCDALASFRARHANVYRPHRLKRIWHGLPAGVRRALQPVVNRERLTGLWLRCPPPLRAALAPILRRVKTLIRMAH